MRPSQALLDIEGTTTPVAFVHEVLFPYARSRLTEHIQRHREEPAVAAALRALRAEYERDRGAAQPGREPPPQPTGEPPPEPAQEQLPHWDGDDDLRGAGSYLVWLSDRDRKSAPLKDLQGLIWRAGYRSGELRAPVYDDVPVALERWSAAGAPAAIYSSGSTLAQKLLFAHTTAGDLTPLLGAYFDTGVGAKRDAASYARIVGELGCDPAAVLFVSDTPAELDAARTAGLQTVLCVRDAGAPAGDASTSQDPQPNVADRHPAIRNFAELPL